MSLHSVSPSMRPSNFLARSALELLPLELMARIQNFISPRDIISLRKTSKSIANTTRQRSVWITAVRHICKSYNLFSLSFPLPQMSQEMLEHTALSPERFISILSRSNKAGSRPIASTPVQILKPPTIGPDQSYFESISLIPGGRYLITTTSNDLNKFYLCLWDLGFNGPERVPSAPLASLPIDMSVVHTVARDISPTSDGLGIAVFIYYVLDEEEGMEMVVYTIYPDAPSPKFNRAASLTLLHSIPEPVFAGVLVAFSNWESNRVTVWNYETNASVAWEHSIPDPEIYLLNEHILLINCSKFSLFRIPPLSPCIDNTLNGVVNDHVAPLKIFEHPPDRNYIDVHMPPNVWYPGRDPEDGNISFSFIGDLEERDDLVIVLDSYSIPTTFNHSTDPVLGTSPFLIGSIRRPEYGESGELEDIRISDTHVTLLSLDDDENSISLSLVPIRGDGDKIRVEIWKHENDENDEDHLEVSEFTICPATGRLLVLTNKNEINVIDLVPPSSQESLA